jgi:hypothetical protein
MACGHTTPCTIRLTADTRQDAAGVATVNHHRRVPCLCTCVTCARQATAQAPAHQTGARTWVERGTATERSLVDAPSALVPACAHSSLPLTQEEETLLPPYTMEERMRELRQRLVLLRWRAQRLRTRSR